MRKEEFDALVDGLRTSHDAADRMSAGARGRVVRAIRASIRTKHGRGVDFGDLFLPTRRWALLAAVPALLLALVMGPLALRSHPVAGEGVGKQEAMLRMAKANGVALLFIADGQGPHRVYKSSDARKMSSGEVITVTDGAYRDRLEDGPSLVFYQVE